MSDRPGSEFDEDYYLRGPETGKSNYVDYSWKPHLTIPVCKLIMRFLGAQKGDSVLDYGAGLGFYTKALLGLGYDACGYDVSQWAIENCDPAVKGLVWHGAPPRHTAFDYILCKDVLEHIEEPELGKVIESFIEMTVKAALLIVPLGGRAAEVRSQKSEISGEDSDLGPPSSDLRYVSPVDNQDSTHKIAWTLDEWLMFIQAQIDASGRAFTISGSYKMPGVKRAADPYPRSCGFLVLRRFEYE